MSFGEDGTETTQVTIPKDVSLVFCLSVCFSLWLSCALFLSLILSFSICVCQSVCLCIFLAKCGRLTNEKKKKKLLSTCIRHGIFPPIGGFPPIERSHGSFLRSVQIRWENYRVYLTCERFSESNFANLPHASISFLHGTFSNGVNLFCFGHHHSWFSRVYNEGK